MNPTPQTARRHWVMDQLWLFKVGETVDFHGVRATWAASMSPELLEGTRKGDFVPAEGHRENKYLYAKGRKVFLLHSPDGKTWVMLSYATEVDPDLSLDQLSNVASKLKLPDGFKIEIKTLTRDLSIDLRNANGLAHMIGTTSTIYIRAAASTTLAVTSVSCLPTEKRGGKRMSRQPTAEAPLVNASSTKSTTPFFRIGNYAPVFDELTAFDLPVEQ